MFQVLDRIVLTALASAGLARLLSRDGLLTEGPVVSFYTEGVGVMETGFTVSHSARLCVGEGEGCLRVLKLFM